jgi:hypothetical protein
VWWYRVVPPIFMIYSKKVKEERVEDHLIIMGNEGRVQVIMVGEGMGKLQDEYYGDKMQLDWDK